MNPVVPLLRILQIAFIVSVLLFVFVLHTIHPAVRSVNASVQWAIVFCAMVSALGGFYGQRIVSRAPSRSLSAMQGPNPLSPWFTGHIIRFAMAEAVALFGFALRMLGDSSILVYLLFGGGLLLLLLWRPGSPPNQSESQSSAG
jgi:hypothetical protein